MRGIRVSDVGFGVEVGSRAASALLAAQSRAAGIPDGDARRRAKAGPHRAAAGFGPEEKPDQPVSEQPESAGCSWKRLSRPAESGCCQPFAWGYLEFNQASGTARPTGCAQATSSRPLGVPTYPAPDGSSGPMPAIAAPAAGAAAVVAPAIRHAAVRPIYLGDVAVNRSTWPLNCQRGFGTSPVEV